jgi:PEP-CTERM motif
MLRRPAAATIVSLLMLFGTPAFADVVYDNLTPNNLMATAARPDSPSGFEIEAADDFALPTGARINSASFGGLIVPNPTGGPTSISQVVIEIYRVFPNDSDTSRTSFPIAPFSTAQVPARQNSPSDVAFDSRDSAAGGLVFSSSVLSTSFTAVNSVQPGGIHPLPNVATGGNGPLTGQEILINVSFATPFDLPPDHYFFVPQVLLTNGGQFYWLSASRPISGTDINGNPTTPFPAGFTDLQTWTRDAMLDPDWLRVGTDIVDTKNVSVAPTFNAAFSLNGTVPEPSTLLLIGSSLVGFATHIVRRRRPAK